MDSFSTAVSILSAMITPAVLILACASLSISTSNRLGRIMDRTRSLEHLLEQQAAEGSQSVLSEEEYALLRSLFLRAARSSRLLHRSLASLYVAIGIFVATSVGIGLAALVTWLNPWIPIVLGLLGGILLLYSSVILILESRTSSRAMVDEMEYLVRRSRGLRVE